ncbi:hypothetical protein AB0J86_09940 [Micromonospora sp. NPDC049559]|uniref:hypothetical protein n=1 Tax=Micromonospora sp. NPDC049559 TaxID=3155923 RepID=UPI0034187946
MPLPLPHPAVLVDLTRLAVGQATGTAAALAAAPARALGLLDGAEALLARITAAVERVEAVLDRAETVVGRAEAAVTRTERVLDEAEDAVRQVGVISAAATVAIEQATRVATGAEAVVADAGRITGDAATAMARAEAVTATADELLTAYGATLLRAAPMAGRFVEQLSAEEVDAAIRLIDELPKLTEHVTSDVLPILATLDRVGPDIHELLEVTRELRLAVAGIPGLKLLARRGDRLTESDQG